MAQSINDTYLFAQDLIFKDFGGYLGPEEFIRLINQAQYARFNELYGQPEKYAAPNFPVPKMGYARTQAISEALSPFVVRATPTFASGTYTVPADLEHQIALRYGNVPVTRVEVDRLGGYLNSSIDAPSSTSPIYVQIANTYKIYPSTLTTGFELEYLRLPVKAIWGYTLSSNRPVYDSGTSVDLEWSDIEITNIVYKLVSFFAVSTRDGQLYQEAEQQKANGN